MNKLKEFILKKQYGYIPERNHKPDLKCWECKKPIPLGVLCIEATHTFDNIYYNHKSYFCSRKCEKKYLKRKGWIPYLEEHFNIKFNKKEEKNGKEEN